MEVSVEQYRYPYDVGEIRVAVPHLSSPPAVRSANLELLMERSHGSSAIRVGLLDGPIANDHAAFESATIISAGPASEAVDLVASPHVCTGLSSPQCS